MVRRWAGRWLGTLVLGGMQVAIGQPPGPGVNTFRPDRGFRAAGTYALEDTESVNVTNGNVNISIPLAKTPPGRTGTRFELNLTYNSAVFDLAPKTLSSAEVPEVILDYPSPLQQMTVGVLQPTRDLNGAGPWRYSHRYYLEEDRRTDQNGGDVQIFVGNADSPGLV